MRACLMAKCGWCGMSKCISHFVLFICFVQVFFSLLKVLVLFCGTSEDEYRMFYCYCCIYFFLFSYQRLRKCSQHYLNGQCTFRMKCFVDFPSFSTRHSNKMGFMINHGVFLTKTGINLIFFWHCCCRE